MTLLLLLWSQQSSHIVVGDLTAQQLSATRGLDVLENAIKTNHIRLACFAVNVRFDQETGVTLMANNLLLGNHWALVVIDLKLKTLWYEDSLGYPLPLNIDAEMASVLEVLSSGSSKTLSIKTMLTCNNLSLEW